ncbi:MAG: hypothetical protein ACJ76K_04235 [Solirubrobacteraceae bacterium]
MVVGLDGVHGVEGGQVAAGLHRQVVEGGMEQHDEGAATVHAPDDFGRIRGGRRVELRRQADRRDPVCARLLPRPAIKVEKSRVRRPRVSVMLHPYRSSKWSEGAMKS